MLITITIDVHDLDSSIGPPSASAKITFARLVPTEDGGTLISTRPVAVPLTSGHGTTQLQADTAYLVGCYGIPGFTRFAVLTGPASTSLGALWRTGQIDPATAQPLPETPTTVLELLAEAEAVLAAVTARTVTAVLDPDDSSLIDLTFPSEQLDPGDDCLVSLTVGT